MVVFKKLNSLNVKIITRLKEKLWLKIFVGMLAGILTGILLGSDLSLVDRNVAQLTTSWLVIPGLIFINLLQMIMVPLIFSSIILGICSGENLENVKKLGIGTLIYFVFTTFIAVAIGIALSLWLEPGKSTIRIKSDPNPNIPSPTEIPSLDKYPELFMSFFPKNPFLSITQGEMLNVIVFSILLGIAILSVSKEYSKPILEILNSVFQISMKIVNWAMALTPFAVFGLMVKAISSIGVELIFTLGVYMSVVLLGLIAVIGVYSVILIFLARRNPIDFFTKIASLQLLAFSTSSSAAVMPVSIQTATENLGVKKNIAEFIIPVGATINMDGTALYQAVATVFLAQYFGIELTPAQLVFILFTTVGASIGTPSTPGIGIVILTTILAGLGIPTEGIGIILGVDRFLDMCRTTVNVTGDITASCVMDRIT
ncbi:dicarboxylate/amino acid:cation symporter [Leptospira santarosai]|uniref:Transporter, dicarboxylate/amino acid:cation Na+/H+ symporter family protein n=1 Tax=Leptospira santarosai serovar Arenal str. MAVJ 401 TaxID=1049976 RepID=M6K568_9LEPT|nr:dicarboxylate/amino acid:cation symporter [Leptospira santarosai]EMM75663.1 transporter, dicarboxylate/amino acid:cation Na+/H+ symporter family protein [Leptospira santarosai str. 2000030832]EMN22877.1 transporter, dicarboxylate/amino acid:cation Na+/H+ symporter family protein [Leptospira santarosai serovar Arenal str. MAVJ 401]MDI7186305.1 dicarboxylate/amino acid:cation symporter [Leptospira santarosai]MDI7188878.1 dicarboxylate/amino acid:cation symporter [Leptospira santarosai]MDI7198